ADLQRAVGAGPLRGLRHANGFGGRVRAGAGHDLRAAPGALAHEGDHALVFVVRERGRFAGGAAGREGVGALFAVPVHEFAECVPIDFPTVERRDDGDGDAGEQFAASGWHDSNLGTETEKESLKSQVTEGTARVQRFRASVSPSANGRKL